MKKILSLILALTVCLTSLSVLGYADYNNGNYISGELSASDYNLTWHIDGKDGVLVISGEGVIPSIYETDWSTLEFSKVKIGEGITGLKQDAFLNVLSVDEVVLPVSLKYIGERAFYNCKNLKCVSLDNVTQVGSMAFFGCESLESVELSDELTGIGNYAFGYTCNEELDIERAKIDGFKIYGNSDSAAQKYAVDNEIYFITFSGEIKNADSDLRWYFDSVDGTLVIEGTGEIPAVGMGVWNEFSFKKLIIGNGITSIADEAFLYSQTLEIVEFPDTLEVIGERSFYGCLKLETADFENIKSVGVMAFFGCESLKNVISTGKLTHIGNFAFGYTCDESLDIERAAIKDFKMYGDSDSNAQKYADDNNIDFIAFSGEIKNTSTDLKWHYDRTDDTLYIDGTGEIPTNVSNAWDRFTFKKLVIGYGVSGIAEEAFLAERKLETVKLSKTVLQIGERAFYACNSLKSVDFATVHRIGTMAFFDCDSLESVTLPQTVFSLGDYAFGYYCDIVADIEHAKRTNFTIRGKSGTVVSEYAENSEFTFVDLTPEQPSISLIYTDKIGVTFFWNKIQNADFYSVFRKTGSGKYVKLAHVDSNVDAVYCDTAVKNGTTYTYKVVATVDGYESFDAKTATIKFQKIDTPELVSAKMMRNGISVTWNSVKSAKGYILYRRTATTDWSQIADFKGNVKNYTDTTVKSGVKYFYTVKAYNGILESGCDYDGVTAMYLSVPKLSKVSNVADGIEIRWKKVSSADGYIIGRKTGSSSWKQIAKVKNVASYTDKTAKIGTSYTYTVVPISGNVKGFYNETGLTCKRLEKVTLKSVSNINGGVKIAWQPLTKGSGYIVYRKTNDGKWTKIATVSGIKSGEYTDKTVKSGTKYTYTVKVYSGSNYGAYDTIGKTVTYLSVPKLNSVSSAKNGVTVKWNKVNGANGYYVYRKTGNGGWKKIAQVKGNSKVSYLDKSAQKGQTYSYTVKAYNGKAVSSYNTNGLKIKDKY